MPPCGVDTLCLPKNDIHPTLKIDKWQSQSPWGLSGRSGRAFRHHAAMSPRVPLPPGFAHEPFAVAAARATGLGERRLYGRDLTRPFHGVRAVPQPVPEQETLNERETRELLARCREYAPRLRAGHFFSHQTAARLWGCPLPTRFDAGEPLHVANPSRAVRCAGIVGHRVAGRITVERFGLPLSDPVDTWLAVAGTLPLDELVAIGDHLILDPRELDPRDARPFATYEELAGRTRAYHGHGARAATAALPLLRQGAESRPETLLRLLLARAGFVDPELQAEIRDGTGRWLGYADLYWRMARVVVEYDGQHHRTDSRAYDRDMTRIEDFVAAGNAVVRVRKQALFGNPSGVITRVHRAFASST